MPETKRDEFCWNCGRSIFIEEEVCCYLCAELGCEWCMPDRTCDLCAEEED